MPTLTKDEYATQLEETLKDLSVELAFCAQGIVQADPERLTLDDLESERVKMMGKIRETLDRLEVMQ